MRGERDEEVNVGWETKKNYLMRGAEESAGIE